MIAKIIGPFLLAARKSSGYTQTEVAARMGTKRTAVSRVESGRGVPSLDFVQRYALAISRPILVPFGERPVTTWEDRVELVRRVYGNWFAKRAGHYYPRAADIILRTRPGVSPEELYLEMLRRASDRVDWGVHRYGDEWQTIDLRGPIAVAAMYHDVIDWGALRRRIRPEMRLADRTARRRAREIVSSVIAPR